MRALTAFFCLLVALGASAQDHSRAGIEGGADGGFPADPYYVASPDQMIRQGVDRLVGFLMGSVDPAPEAVRSFVELEIAPHFDFAYMAQWAAGPLFHRLGPHHRAAMTTRLRHLFLDALARHLGTLERPLPRVDVFPARPGRGLKRARR